MSLYSNAREASVSVVDCYFVLLYLHIQPLWGCSYARHQGQMLASVMLLMLKIRWQQQQ